MLNQIFLVVFLGGVEFPGRGYLGRDRTIELARFVPPCLHAFCDLLLSLAVVEDGRAVLRAHVVVLAVEGGWIVHAKEVIRERFVGQAGRIEYDLDGFCMPGTPPCTLSGKVSLSSDYNPGSSRKTYSVGRKHGKPGLSGSWAFDR